MILLAVAVAAAGPWTRGEDAYYVRFGPDVYVPWAYVDPLTGQPVETDRRYLGVQAGVYGEVGLPSDWPVQVVFAAPLSVGSLTFETDAGRGRATTWRPGDLRVGLQAALGRDRPLAVLVEAKIPGYANGSIGANQGIYQNQFPKPGDGQIDLGLHVLGGVTKGKLWSELSLGWVHRTEVFVGWDVDLRFVDGVAFANTTGARVGRAYVMLKVQGRWNPVDDDVSREWLGVGPSVLYDLSPGLAIEGYGTWEPTSAQAARGIGAGVGVSVRRPKP